MTRSIPIPVLLLAFALLLATAVACAPQLEEPAGGEVVIVTTTYPLTYFAQRIGGERVAVTQLVKPGVEAHDFEPAPSDVRTIAESELFIFNHPSFEGWALNAANASSSGSGNGAALLMVQTINLQSTGEDHGGQAVVDANFDPHIWLNPLLAREQADRILAALVAVDPEGAQIYTRNSDGLDVELVALDELIAKQLSGCELDSVVVSHLAFGHMAERYRFEQIGLAGLSPEFESGPSHTASIIRRINELDIRHILQEPIVSDRLAKTAAAETGAELLTLHPLEVRTADEVSKGISYIDIMQANGDALSTALRCG